jgi:hypothetical protein
VSVWRIEAKGLNSQGSFGAREAPLSCLQHGIHNHYELGLRRFVGAQTFSPEADSESIREQAENSPTLAPAGQTAAFSEK